MFIPTTGIEGTRRLAHSALPDAPVEPHDDRPRLITRLVLALRSRSRVDDRQHNVRHGTTYCAPERA